jgi:hypothetical protein
MTISVGPKGYVDLIANDVGPKRKVKVVSFTARADDGPITGQHFPYNASKNQLTAVIDMTIGRNVTGSFRDTGSEAGNIHLSQVDTGTANDNWDGHIMWAVITDTGT